MADYERAVAVIEENEDDADFAGPRPPELIARAEQAAGVRFPPTYRRFLSEYGAGNLGSTEIYGVIDDDFENSALPDAIWHNLTSRREGLFAFYAVGEGTEFCLDTTRTAPDGEMPIVAVDPSGETKEEVAPDFGSAFLMLVQEDRPLDDDKAEIPASKKFPMSTDEGLTKVEQALSQLRAILFPAEKGGGMRDDLGPLGAQLLEVQRVLSEAVERLRT